MIFMQTEIKNTEKLCREAYTHVDKNKRIDQHVRLGVRSLIIKIRITLSRIEENH